MATCVCYKPMCCPPGVADSYIKLSTGLSQLGTIEGPRLEKFINKVADTFEKARVSDVIVLIETNI